MSMPLGQTLKNHPWGVPLLNGFETQVSGNPAHQYPRARTSIRK